MLLPGRLRRPITGRLATRPGIARRLTPTEPLLLHAESHGYLLGLAGQASPPGASPRDEARGRQVSLTAPCVLGCTVTHGERAPRDIEPARTPAIRTIPKPVPVRDVRAPDARRC